MLRPHSLTRYFHNACFQCLTRQCSARRSLYIAYALLASSKKIFSPRRLILVRGGSRRAGWARSRVTPCPGQRVSPLRRAPFQSQAVGPEVEIYVDIKLNMGSRRSRPSYDYKSSFWPPAGMIMVMIIVRARNFNYNCDRDHNCQHWEDYNYYHFETVQLPIFVASISANTIC